MNGEPLENPVFGYVVISVALLVGLLSATVFSQTPLSDRKIQTVQHDRSEATPFQQESANPSQQKLSIQSDWRRTFANPRRWILGIRSTPTSAGCIVTAVIEGSAAEKAGLTVGDRVITIDGHQVGWVGRDLAPIHRAVDAARAGKSRLLVQNSGSGCFRSISIHLRTVRESLGH